MDVRNRLPLTRRLTHSLGMSPLQVVAHDEERPVEAWELDVIPGPVGADAACRTCGTSDQRPITKPCCWESWVGLVLSLILLLLLD